MLSQIVGPVDFNSAAVLCVAFICLSVVATSLVVKQRSRLLLDQEFDLAKIRTRMGNRAGSDDGWNFRGRGAVQTTGRDGYRRLAATTGLDVVTHPNLVNDPAHFLKCGVADFVNCGCLQFARKDDVRGAHKAAERRLRRAARSRGVAFEMEA